MKKRKIAKGTWKEQSPVLPRNDSKSGVGKLTFEALKAKKIADGTWVDRDPKLAKSQGRRLPEEQRTTKAVVAHKSQKPNWRAKAA
jgi:hypothetical protein